MKNVNTISTIDGLVQWKAIVNAAEQLHAAILCLQEPNTNWHPNLTSQVQAILQKASSQSKISTSSSLNNNGNKYQPGGTMTTVLGIWTLRVWEASQDASGLRRWSQLTLAGRNGRRIIIITRYRVCNQQLRLGSNTAYVQQHRLLIAKGYCNPDPRDIFIEDLILHIHSLQNPDTEIIVALDANKDTSNLHPTKDLGKLLSQTGLIDLHHHRHTNTTTPPMYNRGQHTIDICLGTLSISQVLIGAWYLPFGQPNTLTGDHHTIGLDFDWWVLFGNSLPPQPLQIH